MVLTALSGISMTATDGAKVHTCMNFSINALQDVMYVQISCCSVSTDYI